MTKHALVSKEVVERARQHADVLVGVHIRHGDYAKWRHGRYYFPVAKYCEWMAELVGQFPGRNVSFLVCSNEPRSASEFPGLSVRSSTGVPIEDMYALAQCDYIIGPVSSFTQWASFYGNKPLIHLRELDMRLEREHFAISSLGEVPH